MQESNININTPFSFNAGLTSLLSKISEVLIYTDTNGIIRDFTGSIFNYCPVSRKEEIINKKITNLFTIKDNNKNILEINHILNQKNLAETNYCINMNANPELYFPLIINTDFDQQNNKRGIFFLINTNIKRNLENNSPKIYQNSKLQNKTAPNIHVSDKDKFFSLIAHDLKSPFTGLLSYTEFLKNDFNELSDYEKKEYIDNIYKITSDIYELLENLIAWSRIQTNRLFYEPEVFNLTSLVNKVLSLYKFSARMKNINFVIELADPCNVYADQNMIYSVIRNLISNAVKFSNENNKIEISEIQKENCVEITVTDYGIGISDENKSKLFRFDLSFTTSGTKNESGSGLGLLIAKELIEINKGHITVESEQGKGSKFTFTIPTIAGE